MLLLSYSLDLVEIMARGLNTFAFSFDFLCNSLYRNVSQSVCLSVSLSNCLSVQLFPYPAAYLSQRRSAPCWFLPPRGILRLLSRLASAGDCRRRLLLPPLLLLTLLLLPFVFFLMICKIFPFTVYQHTYIHTYIYINIHLNIDSHFSISHSREFHCQLLFLFHLQFQRVARLIKIVL